MKLCGNWPRHILSYLIILPLEIALVFTLKYFMPVRITHFSRPNGGSWDCPEATATMFNAVADPGMGLGCPPPGEKRGKNRLILPLFGDGPPPVGLKVGGGGEWCGGRGANFQIFQGINISIAHYPPPPSYPLLFFNFREQKKKKKVLLTPPPPLIHQLASLPLNMFSQIGPPLWPLPKAPCALNLIWIRMLFIQHGLLF